MRKGKKERKRERERERERERDYICVPACMHVHVSKRRYKMPKTNSASYCVHQEMGREKKRRER